jgi:hypothetical protein
MLKQCSARTGLFIILVFFGLAVEAAPRNDVLVIVNDNSIDSPAVGSYYAQQREVPVANVVHVKVPDQYFINWTQFQSLRDQVLRFGICPSIATGSRPAACTDASLPIYTAENISALTTATPIKYIVTTRGVPTRTTVDGDTLPTSVDNYLKFWLARYFTDDVTFAPYERASAFGNGNGMRIVNPATDGEYVIGRIDGVDLAAAKALVDRARETEDNGWYGMLYGVTAFAWLNDTNRYIYYGDGNPWRYQLGLFGEQRPECNPLIYYAYNQSETLGKSSPDCRVQIHDSTPGLLYSRQPKPSNAVVYFGEQEGQTIQGGFDTLLNWRKNDSCQVTLCSNAADPAACRAASTDPYKEINTDCVGVESGFIGYNHQSYPVAILGNWPTGWGPYGLDETNDVPVVLDNTGVDDNYSLWFYQPDEAANPNCYAYTNGVLSATRQPCIANRYIGLTQTIGISDTNPASPPTYRLAFNMKGESLTAETQIKVTVRFDHPPESGGTCPAEWGSCSYYFTRYLTLPAGTSSWTPIQFDAAPPANVALNYNQVWVNFTGTVAGGRVGFDAISLKATGNPAELLVNGSFNQGHKQASYGDFAANFLGRLGGTAFWGSLSHWKSNGHSFSREVPSRGGGPLNTLVYFMRGLPLGDAVWLGDGYNSGIFYGDPLYSPLAVRLMPNANNYSRPANIPNQGQDVNSFWYAPSGALALNGSTVNGRNSGLVSTTYSIDYCTGRDFFVCGTAANQWRPTGLSGTGGHENMPLGTWDTSAIAPGVYTLRLGVSSVNASKGKNQTFYDYAPILIYNDTSDADNDGLTDIVELRNTYGTEVLNPDTDGDGLLDSQEVNVYRTNPISMHSDADGLSDGDEVLIYHTDPLKIDTDGDGYMDGYEINKGGNPLDSTSLPLAITSQSPLYAQVGVEYRYQMQATWPNVTYSIYIESYSSGSLVQSGISIDQNSGLLTWMPDSAGNYGVLILATSGSYSVSQYFNIYANTTGDINADGIVDDADALLAERSVLGLITLTGSQRASADLNHDGVVDLSDVLLLKRKILGLGGL